MLPSAAPIGYNASSMNSMKPGQFLTGLVFAATIFLGAFLLFQVQPLLGRFLVPWFGGSPEVWTACMLFFQVFLLAGYSYAHLLVRLKKSGLQAIIHIGLLGAALFFLPILPKDIFKPTAEDIPILQILLICSVTVGVPYLLLAATSPLVQVWFSRIFGGRNPYRLYALSNTGSLLALASFPFLFEPVFTRVQMVHLWSVLFALFAVLSLVSALLGKRPQEAVVHIPDHDSKAVSVQKPAKSMRWLWLALPAVASVELLAVTNLITQDVAVVPFLWVLPLSVYLLTFIICFEHQRWYHRKLFIPLFIVGIIGIMYVRVYQEMMGAFQIIGVYVFLLFACAMICHGELYKLRPSAKYLTGYYLMIAAGGALGGFFVAIICPLIFKMYVELYLGLLACTCLLLLIQKEGSPAFQKRRYVWIALLIIAGLVGVNYIGKMNLENRRAIDNRRNFFGVLTIWEEAWDDPQEHRLSMQHGTTLHGLQFQLPPKRAIPTAYYSPDSGIGLTLENFPKQTGRRIGVVGLGVGTIAAYGYEGDIFRFYEINPEVERLARKYFTYLDDSLAAVEIVIGDARLSMEREPPQSYDVLVIDAFSSDAIPIHLLTVEALKVYLKHLAEGGVLAFHISTMHLDLNSVVWKLAEHLDLETSWIEGMEYSDEGALDSDWILLAKKGDFLSSDVVQNAERGSTYRRKEVMLWTDDHIDLLEILKKTPLN